MVKDIPLYLNSLKKGNRNNFSKKTRKMGILKSFVLGMVLSCSGLLNAQTAVPMSSQTNLTYTENFADITNWTNNFAAGIGANRWASVAINATGTLGDGVRTTVSTATFSTLTTGGVQKGTGNIVQLSTSTTNSNAIDFFMDFTGVNAGTVSFDVATIFNNTGDRDSRLKLFWSTNGTAWTELTGTNLPYTARNNVVGSGSVSVALPAAFNNSSTARLRFYEYSTTTGATPTGSQPKISVDNLVVKAIKINTTGALSALSTTYGTASSNTSFNVEAFNIGSNLSVTAPSGFEVSTTAVSGFASSISLTPASGNVALTTIYVRLAAATNAGTYSGDVVCAATGASTVNVATVSSTVSQASQTITFGTLSDVDEFDPDFNLTATASSGLTVTYSSSDPLVATVSGNTVTIVGDGTTTITASQSGNSNYTAASNVDQSLTVNAASGTPQTITFNALSNVTYGEADFNLTATASSALTVSYLSSNTAVATISGNTVTIVGPGTTTITASQAGDGSFQPAPDVDQSLTVDVKTLTVTGASANNKAYNKSTAATITGATLNGIVGLDVVTVSGGGTFDDANVANGINVTANLTLGGADAAKYTLNQPIGLTANITTKDISVTGISVSNKEYNGTNAAVLTGTASLSGVESGDNVNLDGTASAIFTDVNVNTAIPVTITGFSISGTSSGNYNLLAISGYTADIIAKALTVIGLSADDKTYDATDAATLTGTGALNGIVTGEEANVSLDGTPVGIFADANAATGKNVTVSGYSISGTVSGNYTLTPLVLSADITVKTITVSGASASDKAYDGTTTVTVSGGTLSGVETADNGNVSVSASGIFAQSTIGDNIAVTLALTGSASGNYFLTQPGITANITAAACANQTVAWNFTAGTAAISSSAITNLTVSNLSQGNNNGTTTLLVNGSVSSGYGGASGTFNAGAAIFSGTLNTATSTYFEFTLTPASGYVIDLSNISFGTRSTGTGPLAYAIRSSKDAYASNVASGTMIANSVWVLKSTATSFTSNPGTAVTFRIYGYNGTGAVNTANWRIDDLNLTVKVLPVLSSALTATVCDAATFTYTPTSNASGASYKWTRASVAGISNAVITTPQTTDPSEMLDNTTVSPVDAVYAYQVIANNCYNSQDVTVTVNPTLTASVTISSDDADDTFCTGTSVTFTATPTNGGTTPIYQWKIGATNAGTDSPTFTTSALADGDIVTVEMTSNATPCLAGSPATSTGITNTVIIMPVADDPSDVTACDSYTLPALTVGNYFTGTGGTGTALSAGNSITSSQTLYVYAETGTTPNCSDENSFVVTINATPTADDPADVTACDSYELLPLTIGNYFTGAGGTGTALSAGNMITSTQTIYVYAETGTTPNCSDENSLVVTINATPTTDDPTDVTACDSYTLPALTVGNYFTGTGGTGTALSAGNSITSSQTLYVYAETGTTPNCSDENS
ncbi:MAG: YDG domain-containing protein, partial [Bacteroidota bacterium]